MKHAAFPSAPGSASAMGVIAALLEQRTGQQIGASRAWRLEAALKPILRDLHLGSMDELASQLVVGDNRALSDRVVDALLNQETSFFRDGNVLDHVIDAVADLRAAAPGRRLRLWSTGCSTGQEPLSLAMLLDERGLGVDAVEIVATDVSAGAIARARAGRYSQFEIQRGLSVRRMMTWFEGTGAEWSASPDLLRRVQYRRQNLVLDPPPAGGFDLVLCRNVLLYFSPEVRRTVFAGLARACRPGALLVLGAGETVIGQTDLFAPSPERRGLYQRTDVAP